MKLGTAMVVLTGTSDSLQESGDGTKAGKAYDKQVGPTFSRVTNMAGKVICLDAMLPSEDVYKILTQSGKDMSIDLPTIQPRFSALGDVFRELMNPKSDILDVCQKYVLGEFYCKNRDKACVILRVLFKIS